MSRTDAELLAEASKGFDLLFSNEIAQALELFSAKDGNGQGGEPSPFHLVGQGVCVFLEAAMGMESARMAEASRVLALAEAATRKHKTASKAQLGQRFPPGTDMEIMNADAVVLLGITHALSESYMGYLQCIYSLNSAHSKFTKLYKTVFPSGLDGYRTPAETPVPSRKPSSTSLRAAVQAPARSSLFGSWSRSTTPTLPQLIVPDGPIEDMIVAGTAFGYGLFNLVFSLLPKRVQSVVGFLGFKHDRKLALQALAVSAAKKDVHSVFAGLVLMTYHGVVLLMSGFQADEAHILKQYKAIVDDIDSRYPAGSLWILNRAKILRMSYDPESAIRVLEDGLKAERKSFAQADTLLVFELAWTLLAQRRYEESAQMFVRIIDLNTWSHATYYFLAAGCYVAVGNVTKAQELFDKIENLVESRKVGGKDLPTEVLIKKKIAFYKEKQQRWGGDPTRWAECVKISPAEELGIFWNTHSRIPKAVALEHVKDWEAFSPPIDGTNRETSESGGPHNDLDSPDELALRCLLFGIVYRTLEDYSTSRRHLDAAHDMHPSIKTSTWIGGVAAFERVVLGLKEAEALSRAPQDSKEKTDVDWRKVLKEANEGLDHAMSLAPNSVDLSSRLDTRVAMLRDEIASKKDMLGFR